MFLVESVSVFTARNYIHCKNSIFLSWNRNFPCAKAQLLLRLLFYHLSAEANAPLCLLFHFLSAEANAPLCLLFHFLSAEANAPLPQTVVKKETGEKRSRRTFVAQSSE